MIIVDIDDPRKRKILVKMFIVKRKRGQALVGAKHRSPNDLGLLCIVFKLEFPKAGIDPKLLLKKTTA